MKRKAYEDLLNWKSERHQEKITKSLLVKGARQVGKTYIINEFGKNEYSSFLHIDFFRQPELKAIFDGNITADGTACKETSRIAKCVFQGRRWKIRSEDFFERKYSL